MDYQDKLRLAKEALDSGSYDKETIEYIFPELKESEDEKIIKSIKDAVEYYWSDDTQAKNDIIAWLKKQNKPQVRTGNEWVNIIDDACEHRYAEEYAHGEYCHQQSFRWGFQEGVDWFEKQVEQKPTWSEEDENMLDRLIKHFDWESDYRFDKNDCDEAQDWLKSLKERNTWKPSDRQMKQLGWVAEQNKDNALGKELMMLYDDLKKLSEE